MIRSALNKMLLTMKKRYDYDVRYQQDILKTNLGVFLKFMGFQTMATHNGNVPVGPLYAVRIRTIISEDCGPCTQLAVNMALEAKLEPSLVRAIIDRDLDNLPEEVSLVVRFTELVLAHDPEADDLRQHILTLWGTEGLITIGFAISSYRVYPALKYTLGYGTSCSRIQVNNSSVAPKMTDAVGSFRAH